jgi:HAD superfamily hydrolase (TIGR01509 family)
MTIRGVVFDNDNTIAKIYPDPRSYWLDVFLETVRECGGKIPAGRENEYMLAYYTGKGFMARLSEIGLKTSWDEFQRLKGVVDERKRISYIKAEKAGLFPDAVEFIRHLSAHGIKYGVATFSTRRVVMAAFDALPDFPRPEGFFGWDDSLKHKLEKPNPEIAYRVLKQMKVSADDALMVGDRLTDIELGNQAGMTTVLVKRVEEDGPLVAQIEREIEDIQGNMARLEDFNKVPDYQVTKLTEIIPLL